MSGGERPQAYALDRAATGTGKIISCSSLNVKVRGTTVRACLFCVGGELPRGNQIPVNLSDIINVRQISYTGLGYIAQVISLAKEGKLPVL